MATALEQRGPLGAIIAELPQTGSRQHAVVPAGTGVVASGTVVGSARRRIGRAVATVTGTGNGTVSDVRLGPLGLLGTYTLTCTAAATNGGTFRVETPDGRRLRDLVLTAGAGVSTRYVTPELELVVTDGSTDFAVGDTITVVVSTTAPTVIGTGNGTISAITPTAATQYGTYVYRCVTAATNGGTFRIFAPDGASLGDHALTAGAGASTVIRTPQIIATITDGATDFAVGDEFRVAVSRTPEPYVAPWTPAPTATDGREVAIGVALITVDATTAAQTCPIVARTALVAADALVYAADVAAGEAAQAGQQLAAAGVVVI